MIQAIFQFLLNAIASVIQIIAWPINFTIEQTMPVLDTSINLITNVLSNIFEPIYWAIGLVPPSIINTLTIILSIEIAKHTIFASTHGLIKVWNLFQKIKFW